MTEAGKAKLRAAHLGRKNTPEARAKMSATRRGMKHPPGTAEKIGAAHRGMKRGPEARRHMSVGCHRRWDNATEEQKRIWMAHLHCVRCSGEPTYIERLTHEYLDSRGVKYLREYKIGRYAADIYIPSLNLIVECDGERFHTGPRWEERDRKRDAFIVSRGFQILRLPGADIVSGEAFTTLEEVLKCRAVA